MSDDESVCELPNTVVFQAERRIPGFSYNFLRHLLLQSNLLQKVDFSQTLLRLGGQAESDGEGLVFNVSLCDKWLPFWQHLLPLNTDRLFILVLGSSSYSLLSC